MKVFLKRFVLHRGISKRLYINDLPLAIPNFNVGIFADDTTLWETNSDLLLVQMDLQDSLNKASSWFSLKKMVPNTKKT